MNHFVFVSYLEPKNIIEAEKDPYYILAMQEELNQFERNKVWELVERPKNLLVIGIKLVLKNKLDEKGNIIRNKTRLVAQGYNQEEKINLMNLCIGC